MHGRWLIRRVQQVLDREDTLDLARLREQVVDHLRALELAAQRDDTARDADIDLSLRGILRAEELRLDLARERRVVVALRLVAPVAQLRHEPTHAIDRTELRGQVSGAGAERGTQSESSQPPHCSSSRFGGALPIEAELNAEV